MGRLTGRGQLLLAGAFVLAVTLIGLTVVFSAGNYTNVMASEDPGATSGSDAVAIRQSVRADLESALRLVHRNYAPGNRKAAFEDIVGEIGSGLRDHYAHRGRLVDVAVTDPPQYTDGERIIQSSDGPFTVPSSSTPGTWTITNTLFVRNTTFVFSDVPSSGDPHFRIVFQTAPTNEWVVEVYERAATNEWKVNVRHERSGSTLFDATCTRVVTGGGMTVNLSAATVNGKYCRALAALDPGINYQVRIENGDRARGRFWMTTPNGAVGLDTCTRSPTDACEDAIFSTVVNFRYQSGTTDYVTGVRIWPGVIR